MSSGLGYCLHEYIVAFDLPKKWEVGARNDVISDFCALELQIQHRHVRPYSFYFILFLKQRASQVPVVSVVYSPQSSELYSVTPLKVNKWCRVYCSRCERPC